MIFVVTPTYNEKENLKELVERVFALEISDLKMLVVDDNSPDGTAEFAEELAQKYPIKVIRRERKMGLGTAYAAAFQEILNLGAKLPSEVIQMDADLSHDPKVIPALLEKIKKQDVGLGFLVFPWGGGVKM